MHCVRNTPMLELYRREISTLFQNRRKGGFRRDMVDKRVLIEVCIDSVESALAAVKGGADRLEICDNILGGGTTPSYGMIKVIKEMVDIDLNILIRPRCGDFLYSDHEIEVIKSDIDMAKELKVNGVVIGVLREDGKINTECMKELIERARPMEVTFHRAFDMCRDFDEGIEDLINLGVERVLTSGGECSAYDGRGKIEKIIQMAGDELRVIAGAGIKRENIKEVLSIQGVKEVHLSGKKTVKSKMKFENEKIKMGGSLIPSEYEIFRTDEEVIRDVRRICER